jgi:hypothetical protein
MHFWFIRNKGMRLEKTQNYEAKWINKGDKRGLQNYAQQALRFKLRIGKICRYHKMRSQNMKQCEAKQPHNILWPAQPLHKKWPLIYFEPSKNDIETLSTKSPSIGCLLTLYSIDFNQWILQQIAITKKLPLI